MGITIHANGVSRSFDCGYFGFAKLRNNIAEAFDKDFAVIYSYGLLATWKPKDLEKRLNNILTLKNKTGEIKDCDNDILDFLFESDCEGKASYETCKKIYDLIKDIDFTGKIFTYGAYSDGKDYEYFKEFLKECYDKRAMMLWS